jgi:hypothetical protein
MARKTGSTVDLELQSLQDDQYLHYLGQKGVSWLRLSAQVWMDWRAGVRHVTKFCHLSRLASPRLEAETGELRFGPEVGQKEKGNRAALIISDCHRT